MLSTRLAINDIILYGYHGVLAQERELGQQFKVGIELELLLPATFPDRLEGTLDYREAVGIVEQVVLGESCLLLETLAHRIAAGLLNLPGVQAATVRVCKPHPPNPAVHGGVEVEIRMGEAEDL